MASLYRAGWGFRPVGDKLGYRDELVKRWLQEDGVPLRRNARRIRYRPDVRPATLKTLYDRGAEPEQLAAKFHVCRSTVYTRLQEAGTVLRRRPIQRPLSVASRGAPATPAGAASRSTPSPAAPRGPGGRSAC